MHILVSYKLKVGIDTQGQDNCRTPTSAQYCKNFAVVKNAKERVALFTSNIQKDLAIIDVLLRIALMPLAALQGLIRHNFVHVGART